MNKIFNKFNLKNLDLSKIVAAGKKASPTALTAAGIVLLLSAVVVGIKKAKEGYEEVAEKEQMYAEQGKEMPVSEKVYTHAKHQVSTIVMCVAGTGAIIGSDKIQNRRAVALAMALEASEKCAKDLDGTIKKLTGQKSDEKEEKSESKATATQPMVDTESKLIRDKFTGHQFVIAPIIVEKAIDRVNAEMMNGNPVSIDDFYDFMNVGIDSAGNRALGWNVSDKVAEAITLSWESEPILGAGGVPKGSVLVFEYSIDPDRDFDYDLRT